MNPIDNLLQNLASGEPVVFILIGAVVFSGLAAIVMQAKENAYLKMFFPEKYEDVTLMFKHNIFSFTASGVFKYSFATKCYFTFDFFDEGLVISERRQKACLITNPQGLTFTKMAFGIYKLTLQKDGKALDIMLTKKDYSMLHDFLYHSKRGMNV